ncbi:hypothetical protein GCM10010464_35860 [Pseudonocardia yunnanensis]
MPLFVSDRTLRGYKTLPTAKGTWALDSGGFTELSTHGSWDHGPTPRQYAARVRRYAEEIGGLVWAAPQDWMCEPFVTNKTGLSRLEHQKRTVHNGLEFRSIAPDLPIILVVQGLFEDEYLACLDMYRSAGVDLAAEPVVGVGSVCRRQGTREAASIIAAICRAVPGIRLHGFGIKTSGLRDYGSLLHSADSMAWSYAARRAPRLPGCTGHANCANCARFAFGWRERVLASLAGHATRPAGPTGRGASRKLDTSRRLALSAFRHEAARLERDSTIRCANRDGLSVRAIATVIDLSPARVGQILTEPDTPVLEQLRQLRARWGVDDDPASRAAADMIIANITTGELTTNSVGELDGAAPAGGVQS